MILSDTERVTARGSPTTDRGKCAGCGFQTPAAGEIAAAIDTIPDQWSTVLHANTTPAVVDEAAQLRDELHVVANRISRVLTEPGSAILATVRIDRPATANRSTDPDQVLARLRLSAERLGALVAPLDAGAWGLVGRAGRRSLSVRDLALIPLHRSHARLTRGRG